MHIELIGCTSAGKTTLAGKIVQAARKTGLDAVLSDGFVLKQVGLNWVENEFVRRRLVEAAALMTSLALSPRHRDFFRFAIRTSLRSPGSWLYRLHIARITLKKLGIHQVIHRRATAQQIVLADNEGMLQAVHTLFVHSAAPSDVSRVSEFVGVVPLPDVVAYVTQPEAVLVERIRARGHNRIRDLSSGTVEGFVRRAVDAFDELCRDPAVASRLLVIDGQRNTVTTPKDGADPMLMEASRLVRAAIDPAAEEHTVRSDGRSRAV